jgi:hypothetical protein
VLEASTWCQDFDVKIAGYMAVASVREICAIDSEERAVRVRRRPGDGWVRSRPIEVSSFRSDVLGDEITLDELYEDSGL